MDQPAPRPSPPLPRATVFLLVGCFIAYCAFLAHYSASYASASDASGYFNSARLLSQGRFAAPIRALSGHSHTEFGVMAFQPLGFIVDRAQPHMAPTYPTGLPLHLIVASCFGGWRHAATIVNIFAALGSGLILWILARRLQLSPAWSFVALALFWLCPLTIFAAVQPMSDLLSLLWSLVALYAALRSNESWRWSVLAGLAVSLSVLVRPTNTLLLLPVSMALGWNFRRYIALGLGGLPGGVFFFYYNAKAYGTLFTTGYGDISSVFSRSFIPHNITHFAYWIVALLTPLVCAALVAPFMRIPRRHELGILGFWTLLLIGFYAFYYHSGEFWWYLRFILPIFPVLILAALLVIQHWVSRLQASFWSWLVPVGLLIFCVIWQVKLTRKLEVLRIPPGEAYYRDTANWARAHLPDNAAIFCMQVSGALYFYTPFTIIRWDQVFTEQMAPLFACLRAEKRPVYAVLYDFEQSKALARLGGQWKQIATVGNATCWQKDIELTTP